MQILLQDLRYGARMLVKQPGFTLVVILTLGLGIGASTAIFSAVYPILFAPLPYPQSDRLAVVWESRKDGGRIESTFGAYRAFVERSHSFDALAVMKPWQPALVGERQPERLEGQRVSANYFRTLGAAPMLGRDFLETEDAPSGPNVAVISEALWQRKFAGDPGVIGRQVKLDDNSFTIIGVMPRAFENVMAPTAELWSPLQYDQALPPQSREWGHHLRVLGRLRTGVRFEQAGRELAQVLRELAVIYPSRLQDYGVPERFLVNSLQEEVTSAVRPALLAVLGAVALVLLIACVNVTNLWLTRGTGRRGEFAIRAALGAGRARMLRQVLTESLMLSFCGGALGLMVAAFGVDALKAVSPPELPRIAAIGVNGTVFTFALALTTLIGLLVGLISALHAARGDLQHDLNQSARRIGGGHQRTRRALVVAEVALALVLLVSAGLLLRSLERLFAISPGFDAAHLLTLQVQTAGQRFSDDDETRRFFEQALEAVRQVPGVASAAFTSQLPLSGELDEYGAQFEPAADGQPERGYSSFRYAVSPGYFETMGIPLKRGRWLDARDTANATPVVVISESLAQRKFGAQDPLGKRVHIGRRDLPWFTIVGVAGDVKQASLTASRAEAAYVTPGQWYFADPAMSLVVRTRADAATLAPALRQAIWSVDKDQPIVRVATMETLLAATAAERRFALFLFEAFGLVALALAAIGLYGVLAGSVTERTQEIGLRLALGAPTPSVLRMVLSQGMKMVVSGIGLGLLAAFAVTRMLQSLLYEVSATDPTTFVSVALLLAAVALLACWIPARRATKVDPMIALRCD